MIELLKLLTAAGQTSSMPAGMPASAAPAAGGAPMDMLNTLFTQGKGKQPDPPALPAAPTGNILPQPMSQPLDTERIRRAVASRSNLGMRF